MNQDDIYTRIILVKEDTQVRLTVSEFRDVEYISIREYYRDFDDEWSPGSKGITIPLTIPLSQELFTGLVEILSLAESKTILEEHFKETLDGLYYDEDR